jgi:DNA-binding helix-hairpin-helix protein with protein kinase domain
MSGPRPHPGAAVYDATGATLLLEREIGQGGEGSVWSIEGNGRVAAKFYHDGIGTERAQKLEVMCRLKSESLLKVAAWPTSTLRFNRSGQAQGLLMPLISGYQAAHLLYNPKSRRSAFPEAQFPFIVHSATNIARAFVAVHDAGQVIGDVNHGNLLVSERATVALIDCDSFEITDHHMVYPCLVGVPPYTPPELQGKTFRGIRRTQQHDAFGLAVLLFHMLFLGRHPFAGIYRNGTSDMTIEQAISEYRFAYSPDSGSTHMQAPPSAPLLTDIPPVVSELFIRAFSRSGANGYRPPARDWIEPLEKFAKGLKQCTVNRSHHFANHLSSCPWCRVEGMVGIPMFGIKIVIYGTEHFNIAAVWAQIEAIRPILESVPAPASQNFFQHCTVNIKISWIVRNRRSKRQMSAASILLAITIVVAAQPPFAFSVVVLAAGLLAMVKLWKAGQEGAKEFVDSFREAKRAYMNSLEEWNSLQAPPLAFAEAHQSLAAAKAAFNELPILRAKKLAELNATRRQKQLQRFLESHRIEDATLPNIGKGRKVLLRAYGVEDAFDVLPGRIDHIKGFGPTMRSTLLAWRAAVEQKFQFRPNEGIDQHDVRALEQEINQRRADAIRDLTGGPQKLQESLRSWKIRQGLVIDQLSLSAQRLAQAEVDMKALRHW